VVCYAGNLARHTTSSPGLQRLPRGINLLHYCGAIVRSVIQLKEKKPRVGIENSNGLAEIAVNQRHASRELGIPIGTTVEIVS
jgi:hypothetical protein